MAINTKALLSDSAVDLMNQSVIISGQTYNKIDNFVTIKEEEMASTISFTVFSRLGLATTALTDGTEATSTTLTDTKKTLTLDEYGSVVTSTSLASVATGGKVDLASAELVGINMGETMDKLGLNAVEAGTNTITAGTLNKLAKTDLRTAYEQLSGAGIAKFEDGRYVAFVNPAQISDIKDAYQAIAQYTSEGNAVNGVVGALEGFTIVEDANVTAGTVACFGKNALGKGVGLNPELRITEGNDNLGRTVSVGWYGIVKYGIIDENAVRVITGA